MNVVKEGGAREKRMERRKIQWCNHRPVSLLLTHSPIFLNYVSEYVTCYMYRLSNVLSTHIELFSNDNLSKCCSIYGLHVANECTPYPYYICAVCLHTDFSHCVVYSGPRPAPPPSFNPEQCRQELVQFYSHTRPPGDPILIPVVQDSFPVSQTCSRYIILCTVH